jgi:hypothetical protein
MSKIVKVTGGDYKIVVDNGSNIYLDTSDGNGLITVNGDLLVTGSTTTVESTNLSVTDNIIEINAGEGGNGVSQNGNTAGINIQRGNFSDARLLFKETETHYDPLTALTVFGTWVFEEADGSLLGIKTNSIKAGPNQDLNLVGNGTGVITVRNTTNYEQQVINYAVVPYASKGDDIIPNMKAVVDFVQSTVSSSNSDRIQVGTSPTLTLVQVSDTGAVSLANKIDFLVHGVQKAFINSTGLNVNSVNITGQGIGTTTGNLVISATTNNVDLDAYINLENQATDPALRAGYKKIYAKVGEGNGGTGLYFINEGGTTDELISKTKSLLYSLIL